MYVFGGTKKSARQISKVQNCQLTVIGQLDFDIRYNACTNVDNRLIFVCFYDRFHDYSRRSWKKCVKNTEPSTSFFPYSAVNDSTYYHSHARITNDGGKAFSSMILIIS